MILSDETVLEIMNIIDSADNRLKIDNNNGFLRVDCSQVACVHCDIYRRCKAMSLSYINERMTEYCIKNHVHPEWFL